MAPHSLASTFRPGFLATYRHFHPGHLEDERRCIERWLILAEFLEEVSLPEFLFLDSDMLLFQDLRDYLPTWRGWDAAGAPLFYSFCFFFRPRLVIEFADWILGQYRDPKVMRLWEIRFQRHREGIRQDAGIIQDMELCRLFVSVSGTPVPFVTTESVQTVHFAPEPIDRSHIFRHRQMNLGERHLLP